MNEKVDQMVTEDLEFSKIVIQCERQTGNGPVKGMGIVAIREQRASDVIPLQLCQMQIGVAGDVWFIVEVPRTVKSICVYRENNQK
jgi:hypothetical protein